MVKDTSVATIDSSMWQNTQGNRCPQGGPGKAKGRAGAKAKGKDGSVCPQHMMMALLSLGLSPKMMPKIWET